MCALTCVPFKWRLSFTNYGLQSNIRLVVASSQGAHSKLLEGLGSSPLPKLATFQLSLFHLLIGKSQNNETACEVWQASPRWIGLGENGLRIFGSKWPPQFSHLLNLGLGRRRTCFCAKSLNACQIFHCQRWIPLWTFSKSCQASMRPLVCIGVLGGAMRPLLFYAISAF